MSDGFFFIAVIGFFFVLWLAGGGPTQPISFSGPYITPITTVGVTQNGYGDGTYHPTSPSEIRSTLQGAENSLTTLQKQAADAKTFGEPSSYRGQITLQGGGATNSDVKTEYVVVQLSYSAKASVAITGWSLESVATGKSATIGGGAEIPRTGDVNQTTTIVLQPGDQAIISTGESPIGTSFKENECVGYLGQRQDYTPSISSQCPSPVDEFNKFYTGNALRDDGCYQLMQNTSSCHAPNDTGRYSSYCLNLIDQHLNYNGCVASHQSDSRFYGNTWRIFLNREPIERKHTDPYVYGELWKQSREGIKLLDNTGKTVDLYTY